MNRRKDKSLFPPSIFLVFLIVLLVMSGIHTGLLTLMSELGWNDTIQIAGYVGNPYRLANPDE